ncbi:MAG: hypothetical protein ACRBBR_14950 [Cellvibrionaceae bacterium]
MIQKTLYFLIFITGLFLTLTTFYIEFRVLSEITNFEEPTYNLAQYGLELKGSSAALAHLANIVFGVLAIIVTIVAYKNFRK